VFEFAVCLNVLMIGQLTEFRIKSEPRGPAFEALLNYCTDVGLSGSLVDRFPSSRKGRDARERFLQLIRPQLMGIEAVTGWPGTSEQGATPLMRFSLDKMLVSSLSELAKGLYQFHSPNLPEDLAVYRADGSVLLGSVAHEHLGWMLLSDAERADNRLGLVDTPAP